MQRFKGRTAIVTGGASGIGAACVRAFYAEGAIVAIADSDTTAATKLTAELGDDDRVYTASLDVTDRSAVEDFIAEAVARTGRLDVLVNSAGIREITPVLDLDAAMWHRVVAVNLDGTFHMSQIFARAAKAAARPAVIVNLSSSAGLMGVPNRAAYVAAKHAIVGLTREMAMELGPCGIRVNAVAPGSVRTPLTERYFSDPELVRKLNASHPLGRVADPSEIACAILFLASDDAGFITGVTLPVDGGYTAGKGW
jgi:meso-butanediol dehydrogenase / (S,S)-butanediol dehydrogenase / diacetyl reductase